MKVKLIVGAGLVTGMLSWSVVAQDTAPAPVATPGQKITIVGKGLVEDVNLDSDRATQKLGPQRRDNRIRKDSAFLIKFNLDRVPKDAKIKTAELYFYVWDPHSDATGKTGVFEVKIPWVEAKANLVQPDDGKKWTGENFVIGTDTAAEPAAIVMIQPDEDPSKDEAIPPVEYKVDIAPLAKAWLSGASPNNGLALAWIPDRDVDQGYMVRNQVTASEYQEKMYQPKLIITLE